jgi:putative addiction module CopG family antidote
MYELIREVGVGTWLCENHLDEGRHSRSEALNQLKACWKPWQTRAYQLRYKKQLNQKALNMEVQLTDDQKAFVRQAIQSGRYSREEEALRDALALWEGRERRRAEILAVVDQAEASYLRVEGRRIATREESGQLADEVKRRGLARLNAEENRRS